MTDLLIPNVDDGLRDVLCRRAAEHGRSLEDEVRDILRGAVAGDREPEEQPVGLGTRIHRLFAPFGLTREELPDPERDASRTADFG